MMHNTEKGAKIIWPNIGGIFKKNSNGVGGWDSNQDQKELNMYTFRPEM